MGRMDKEDPQAELLNGGQDFVELLGFEGRISAEWAKRPWRTIVSESHNDFGNMFGSVDALLEKKEIEDLQNALIYCQLTCKMITSLLVNGTSTSSKPD